MKKLFLVSALTILFSNVYAQEEKETPKEGWKRLGNASILFNQAAFNNSWTTGGINSIALDLNASYDLNYLKGDWTWDNKFIAAYGRARIDGSDSQKTNDRFQINSLLGKKAFGYWSYSFFGNLLTQFDDGIAPSTVKAQLANGQTVDVLDPDAPKNSQLFSPAFIQFGPGMLWKKSDNLKVNIAPATSKLILVNGQFTENGSSFGVEQGDTSRYELGAGLQGYYKLNVIKNLSMENILNLFSNYLEQPENVDIDYIMNLVLKVNKYISTNLTFQAVYDHNTIQEFQIRESFGVGFNYGF